MITMTYDVIYLLDGYEANAITVVFPSNNKLNVEPRIETPKYKLSFNRSYSKNNFSLMQSQKCIEPHRQWTRSSS